MLSGDPAHFEAIAETHARTIRRLRAGYEYYNRFLRSCSTRHLPCGQTRIDDPEVHDPICPANGQERSFPMLAEL